MNKIGADKMLSVYWFIIIFIVAAAIVYMTALFYGNPYDVRSVEANLLVKQVSDCFVEENYFIRGRDIESQGFSDSFLDICGIDFSVEDDYGWKDDQFLINVEVYEFNNKTLLFDFEKGNFNLRDCSKELKKIPFCIERSFYSIDTDNNEYIVKIFASVRKTEKNVK